MSRGPNITQRTDGRYCASLQVLGVRKYVYGATPAEVKRKLEELGRQSILQGTLPNPGARTVDDLLNAWLDALKPTLKPRTYADYRETCDRYIRPHLGRTRLSKLEAYHVQALCARLEKRGSRVPSLAYARLRQALQTAVRWGWLAFNPADRIIRPGYSPERKQMWAEGELSTFLAGAQDHWLGPLWLLTIATGCRLGELVGLRWADVDWEAHRIAVVRNLQRIDGAWVESEPKTKAGRRHITIPPEGMAMLHRQKAMQAERRLKVGQDWQDKGLVFTGEAGQPLHRSVVAHALERECRRLGLLKLSPHGLRHLHASLLLSQGLPVPAVSARLGHSNPAITLQVYSHALKHQDLDAAQAIGRALRRA